MKKPKIQIVHGLGIEPQVELVPSIYAAKDTVYIVPKDQDIMTMARSMYAIEKERSEWIRKYENVLSGLNYWKDKALTNE